MSLRVRDKGQLHRNNIIGIYPHLKEEFRFHPQVPPPKKKVGKAKTGFLKGKQNLEYIKETKGIVSSVDLNQGKLACGYRLHTFIQTYPDIC